MNTKQNGLALIVSVALLSSCGGGDGGGPTVVVPPVVTAGSAVLSVATAPTGLAAVRLRVFGPGISSPTVRGTTRILFQQTVADTTTFLLAMTTGGGAFLEVRLANRDRTPTVDVREATAGRADGYRALTASSVVVSTTVQ